MTGTPWHDGIEPPRPLVHHEYPRKLPQGEPKHFDLCYTEHTKQFMWHRPRASLPPQKQGAIAPASTKAPPPAAYQFNALFPRRTYRPVPPPAAFGKLHDQTHPYNPTGLSTALLLGHYRPQTSALPKIEGPQILRRLE